MQKEIDEGSFTPEEAQDIATLIRASEDTEADTFQDEFVFLLLSSKKKH
ncbi:MULTISPECIES: hypothetical protein [spotted fever group]|uniref:Uncharacterized protein n=2 Tax=spotted fever group TaxID=114277 RepID=A0A0F3PER6_RICRH|nr:MULTISPECIES: hypothetical protein [spotted fever group]AFB31979.1 hypothetical protein RMB_06275 [Rickettsia massiliae str. AZT80]KJV78845.1 hypothetical protein RMAECT_0979 [Rickettsia rhipicephali str. Ect]